MEKSVGDSNSRKSVDGQGRYGIQIGYLFSFHVPNASPLTSWYVNRYRTLSIRVDEKVASHGKSKKPTDPADAIAAIDTHLIPTEEVYVRYSTSPTVGLELAAVERRLKDGKNIISPPPTKYFLKFLNYIFGGFNFLMWIAFVVTIVGLPTPIPIYCPSYQ